MLGLVGFVVLGLVGANVVLLRELVRLRRRTRRLAILARDEARRVRGMDRAAAASFARVQSVLAELAGPPAHEPLQEPVQRPTFLN